MDGGGDGDENSGCDGMDVDRAISANELVCASSYAAGVCGVIGSPNGVVGMMDCISLWRRYFWRNLNMKGGHSFNEIILDELQLLCRKPL